MRRGRRKNTAKSNGGLRSLYGLLGRRKDPESSGKTRTATHAAAQNSEHLVTDRKRFEKDLTETLQKPGPITIGRIHALNLSKIKDRMGDEWDAVSERIGKHIGRIIDHYLSEADYYYDYGEANYVLIFGRNDQNSDRAIHAITKEITERVFGEETGMEEIQVRSAAQKIDGSLVLSEAGGISGLIEALDPRNRDGIIWSDADRVASSVSEAAGFAREIDEVGRLLKEAEKLYSDGPMAWKGGVDPEIGNKRYVRLVRILRDAKNGVENLQSWASFKSGEGGLDHANSMQVEEFANGVSHLLSKLEMDLATLDDSARLSITNLDLDDRAPRKARDLPTGLQISYSPVFSAKKKLITTYYCEPQAQYLNSEFSAHEIAKPANSRRMVALLDGLTLNNLIADAKQLAQSGSSALMMLPVHHATLSSERRFRDFVMTCNTIPPEIRRRILFEVVGGGFLNRGSNVGQNLRLLQPFCRAILARLKIDESDFAEIRELGIIGVGVYLGKSNLHASVIGRKFGQFADRAKQHRLMSYAFGVAWEGTASALITAGADYIAGEAIGTPRPSMGSVKPFDFGAPSDQVRQVSASDNTKSAK